MKKILLFCLIIFLLPLIIFLVLIRPIIFIRFGNLSIDRIGRVYDLEAYLIYKKNFTLDIWYAGSNVSNSFLLKIYKRNFVVLRNIYFILQILQILSKHITFLKPHLIENGNILGDQKEIFFKKKIILDLNKQELKEGNKIFKKFNIPNNAKIICFTARDQMYLKKTQKNTSFNYHSYRNSKIENFDKFLKVFLKKGYYIFRMGKIANRKINIKHPHLIDYPFHEMNSDFMDFFIARKSYLWIGSNAGIDMLAFLFRKPLLLLNMCPIGFTLFNRGRTIVSYKKFFFKNSKQKLKLKEVFKHGIFFTTTSQEFKKKNIKVKELNQKEILNNVNFMMEVIGSNWKLKRKTKNLQLKIKKKLNEYVKIYFNKQLNFSKNFIISNL